MALPGDHLLTVWLLEVRRQRMDAFAAWFFHPEFDGRQRRRKHEPLRPFAERMGQWSAGEHQERDQRTGFHEQLPEQLLHLRPCAQCSAIWRRASGLQSIAFSLFGVVPLGFLLFSGNFGLIGRPPCLRTYCAFVWPRVVQERIPHGRRPRDPQGFV